MTREEHLAATLQAELDLAVATSSAVPGLRHPPWVTDARAKTLFRDVDLAELRRQHEDSWRARGVPEKKLPPIQMHKTATGMVILSEGTSGVKSAAEILAARIAAEEAKRPPKGTVRFGLGLADGASGSAAAGATTSLRPMEAVRDPAQAAAKLKNKRIVRFKYAFRPAPWVLPRGEKRPPNAAAAHEAGVRAIGRVRLPVAPSHHRYIESLEDEVSALAAECALRRKMLLAKIDRFCTPMWRPPHSHGGHSGGAAGAAHAAVAASNSVNLAASLGDLLNSAAAGASGGAGDGVGDGDDHHDAASEGSHHHDEHADADIELPL